MAWVIAQYYQRRAAPVALISALSEAVQRGCSARLFAAVNIAGHGECRALM
jgi:hypothetical protein